MSTSDLHDHDRARGAQPVLSWLGLWLNLCLLLWLLVLPAFLYSSPDALWPLEYHRLPPARILVCLAACIVVVFTCGTRKRRWLCNLLIAAILGFVYFGVCTQPLGDYAVWKRLATANGLGASELLANTTYRVVYCLWGEEALPLVAPTFGVVFAFLFLSLCDFLFLPRDVERPDTSKKLCCLSFLATSWHLLFARNYIENTQLSLPFLLLAIWGLHSYSRGRGRLPSRLYFHLGCGWMALACLVHGQNVALLPGVPLVAWLCPPPGRDRSRCVGDLIGGFLVFVIAVASVVGVLLGAGFYLHAGHIHPFVFMPWLPEAGSRTAILDRDHFHLVANILLLASPVTLALPLLLLLRDARNGLLSAARRHPVLVILALGYCGFLFVVQFFLGFPRDFDLMISLGLLLHLYLMQGCLGLVQSGKAGGWAAMAILLPGAGLSWSMVSSLLVPCGIDETPHPRGEAWAGNVQGSDGHVVPILHANGQAREIWLRHGECLILELSSPPGQRTPTAFALGCFPGDPDVDAVARIPGSDAVLVIAPAVPGQGATDRLLVGEYPRFFKVGYAPWASQALPGLEGATMTIQGLILDAGDAGGKVRATNAVMVHWP